MAKKLGTIKSISGSAEVIAVDKSGNQRVLKVGDSLYEGETVKTTSADSKVVIATNNGKELSMIGEDTLSLDPKATAADSQVAALQKALLNGANLEDLEETAAGGTSGGRAGDGMSLGETRFEHGGHYSNINASTSAINPLGVASFAGPAEGKSGGLDSGRGGDDGFYIDTTPPSVIIDGITPVDTNNPADGNPDKGIVKGHSDEPNAPVVVTDKDGKIIGTGTTDDKGNFEITTDPIKPGDKVNVEVTDKAGNKGNGEGTAGDTTYVDTTAPKVEVDQVTPVDTNNPADGNPDKGIVKGHSDEPNAPVVVTDKDGKIIGTGTTDDKGNFEITTDPIKPGDKVNVEVTDKAGNKGNGEGTAGDMDFNDNVAPDAPVITEVTDNAYGGIENGGNVLGINDGFTNDNTPTFKGTAEPNTTIVLKNGNDVIGKDIIVKADGSWEFTPKTPLADGEYNVVAIATDKAGNVSVPSNVATINIDTHVTTPVITEIIDDVAGGIVNGDVKNGLTNDNTPTLKGTAEPFATVKIMIDGKGKYAYVGGELINEWNVKADANGNWEFTTPKLSDGSHTFKVQTTDRAGNNSPESSVVSVNIDTTIGNPKVRFVEDTDGNGVLSVAEVAAIKDGKAHWVIDIPTDGSIKAGDVIQSIDGKGNWVKFVEITDEMIKDGKFEATFNVDINKLKDGKYETPEYRFADEAGNVSESSKASLALDSEFSRQPSNPSITFPEDNDPKDGKISDKENKAGDKDAGKTTAEVIIPQDGSVKPGDKLVVTDENGKQTEKTIEQGDIDNGNIKVPVDLNPGKDNTITAEIINPNNPNNPGKGKGVIGEDSEATKAPEAPVITDVIDNVEGGKFNEDVKGGLTNDSTPTIKGTAKAGSKVEIYDDGNKIGETIAKPDGSWEFTTPELTKQGEHKFTATAENTFGKSTPSNEVTIDLDTIAPVIKEVAITPIDTAAKADYTAEATLIVGVTDTPHATVIAKDKDGNFLGRADVNDKGGFVIDAKPVNPGDKVVFEVTDKAGNTSESEFKAGDLTHPNDHTAPKVDIDTVTPVDETNPSDGTPDKGIVKGKSDEPNAPVVVTDENGKTIGTGTTDDKGNFDITTSPIKPGDKVTVEVTDKAGNKGKDTETAGDMDIIHKDLPETPVITDVIDDVKGYGEDTKVGNVLDVEGHLTNDKTPTIKGTAKAGSTVVIYDNGVEIGKIEKADANWEFTTPVLTKQGEHKFTATAENKFGKSTPSNEVTIDLDSIAPKLDSVKITPIDTDSKADDTAELTMGTGHTDTPNAEILFRDGDNNIIGKGHANSAGDFAIQLDKAVQPGTPVFVQAIDKAGNAGTDMAVAGNIEHPNDHTAPSEPTITFVEDLKPKDGKLNKAENSSDGDNANTTAKISIPADAVVGDVIKYTVNGGTEESHTISVADKNVGHVEIKVPVADGQTSSVTAKIVDQAGNASKEVSSSIDSDFTAPNVKITGIIDNVEGGVYKGNVAGTNTNDNKPTIKGTADANQEVVLYDNNKEMGRVTADKDGNWEFKPSDYKEPLADLVGRVHVIKAVVTDAAGNTSEATSALEVDTTIGAPKVSIKEDADHNGVLSVEEAKNLKDSKIHWEVEIPKDGTVSAGDVLQVLGKDGKWKTEKVLSNDDLGKSFEYEATLSGKHFESPSYRIVDLVGNQSTAIHANVQLDSEFSRQPSNPSITFPEDNDPKDGKISDKENKAGDKDAGKTTAEVIIPQDGSVKPGDKLVVTDENGKQTEKTIEQGDIDNGNIKVPVDLNPGKDNTITAEIINPNNPNNPGKGKGVIGEDSEATKAPEAPVITDVIDNVEGGKFNEDVKGGLTNDSTPTIKGTAKAGSKVEIYDDGNKIGETIAKPDGSWEFTTPELTKQGEHKFTATAENTFGKSTPSNEVTIDLDTKTEKPVIKEIIDNVEGDTGDISSKNNWTNDNTPTLKGSAEAGATVDIYVDGRKAGSVEANDKGEWEYTTDKLSDGDHKFYVEATDKAGNAKESDVEAIKVDTNPGQVVITSVTDDNGVDALNGAYDGATTDNTPTINGFAEPYSTVTVSVKDSNGKVVWSGEVYVEDSLGNWSITVDKPLNDGDYTVEASMQDYVKNPVQNSNVVSLTVDTATDIPEIKEIIDDVAGGIVNGDVKNGLTNDNTPTLKGNAEAGADIKVFIDGKIAGTTKAGFDGSWEFTPRTKLSDGEHKFVVEATDKLGHSAKSVEASVDVDTTIGEPKIKFVEDINGDGKLSTNELPAVGLTDGKLHWVVEIPKDGTVKAGDTLQVYGTDGKWKDVVTLSDADIREGSFTSSDFSKNISEMGRGFVSQPYRFVDPAGNESRGILESIKLDATAPKAPVITDAIDDVKGGKFNENVLGVNKGLTNDNTPTIKGTAEANAKVEIYDNGNKIGETRADSDGKWSFTPNGSVTLPDGEHSITAVAVNVIGRSPASAEAKLMVDTVTPKPTIDAIIDNKEGGKFHEDVRDDVTNDNRPTFKGSAEANATVELFDNGKSMGTTKANDQGEWTLRPAEPMPDGKHEIVAKATDLAGNENWSKGAYSKVDTDAGTVEITAVIDDVKGGKFNENVLGVDGGLTNDSTPTIKGTAKAGSRVEIYDNDKYIGSTIADSDNGTWIFTTPTLTEQGEHKFTAKAINQNGTTNPSNVAKIILDTDIDIKLTEVTPIAEGTTPGAHISTPTINFNTISGGNYVSQGDKSDYVKVNNWVSNCAKIDLGNGNDTLAIGGLVENGVVINAGKGNDKVTIGKYLKESFVNLGEGGANIVRTRIAGISDEINAAFIIKDKNGLKIGDGKTDADGKFDMFIDKAIKPGEKLSVEIVDAAGNKASDSRVASHIEVSGVRYHDNELDVGTNIHAATVVAGNGNDLVVVGEEGKPDGYIKANSKIDLGEGDNEIRVRTNIDHSEIKTGSGDDIVNVGVNGIDGYITGHSKVELGDGNNKLTVGTNIDHSEIKTGSGDDIVNVGVNGIDGYITGHSKVELGAGNDLLNVRTNIDCSTVDTGAGNDVVKVGGYIHSSKVDLGAGDDTLSIGKVDLNNSKVDGGTGYDKLVLENPDKSVNLSDISKFAKNFEELDISGAKNTTLKVGIKDVLDMTDDKNTLKITGDKGDTVDLKGNGWHQGASEDGYTTYTNNTVTIQIKDEIHVI
ncbi:retention module-containing protein [Campylobacter concisus]|uniref:retention module-containing protein n=1 Tax=Campylobacter concisus TaxID=199 RepID=UPI0015E187EA|nr:retention module-containing protein [Campylobacter concisus]